ncbi:MAG: type IX secretion system membrane protein PorP/SprF [Salibacteraceae bacterium]
MMKFTIHIVFVISIGFVFVDAQAQQVFQFSQYQQNLYILNSASAGEHDYLEANVSFRKQWVGIENSPTTSYISANMPIGKRLRVNPRQSSSRISTPNTYNEIKRSAFHAVGIFVAQDSYGPYAINMVSGSYAYHLPIAEELTLSFSPNVSYNSMAFDPSKAQVENPNDQTYTNYLSIAGQSSQLDINVAFWLYHSRFFAGYSTDQLIQDRLNLTNQETLEEIKVHHSFIGGYKFILNRNFILTPSTMVRVVGQAPISADLNVRLDYQDTFWTGITYRSSKTISGMLGIYLNNTFRLGYSFDFALSALQTQNAGSHEVMLGINLFNKEKAVF